MPTAISTPTARWPLPRTRRRAGRPARRRAASTACPRASRTTSWSPACPRASARSLTPEAPQKIDAPAVARLKEQGAVVLGKTAMPEYGWKATSDSPLTGFTRNPWDTRMTTGGSSAGAVAACRARHGRAATGHRRRRLDPHPGRLHRLLRPQADARPRAGLPGLAARHAGAPRAADAHGRRYGPGHERHLAPDARDVYGWISPAPDYRAGLEDGVRGLRIAYSPTLGFAKRVHPEVASAVAAAAAHVRRTSAPPSRRPIPASARSHRRLEYAVVDGDGAASCRRSATASNELGDPGLVAGAARGATIARHRPACAPSSQRAELHNVFAKFHERYDLLLTPALPLPAFEVGHLVPPLRRMGQRLDRLGALQLPLQPDAAAGRVRAVRADRRGPAGGAADRRADRRRRPGAARQPRLRGGTAPSPSSTHRARSDLHSLLPMPLRHGEREQNGITEL